MKHCIIFGLDLLIEEPLPQCAVIGKAARDLRSVKNLLKRQCLHILAKHVTDVELSCGEKRSYMSKKDGIFSTFQAVHGSIVN
jgi:hypothetical protein